MAFKTLIMVGLLMLTGRALADDSDRAGFERFWTATAQKGPVPISKDLAWAWWQWNDRQFTLGFCSDFVTAAVAERFRRFSDEDEMMKTDLGRELLAESDKSFHEGMDYRESVKPSRALCAKQLR